jgi:hypothetical protein
MDGSASALLASIQRGLTLRGEWLGDFVPESFSADEANRRLRRGNTGAHKSRVGERFYEKVIKVKADVAALLNLFSGVSIDVRW